MTLPIDERKFSHAVSEVGHTRGGPGFCFKAAACLFGAALSVVLPALGPSYERLGIAERIRRRIQAQYRRGRR